MKQALESYGGLRGAFTSVVSVDKHMEPKVSIKIPSINQLNNFKFTEAGIVVRKAYKIGHGKMFENSKLSLRQCTDIDNLKIVHPFGNSDSEKVGKVTLKTFQERVDIPDTQIQLKLKNKKMNNNMNLMRIPSIYVKPAGTDVVKQMWVDKCNNIGSEYKSVTDQSVISAFEDDSVVEGWALKKT
ncbi:unnamed protein product [Mytilus coruscus]|uniref:Uncharacterized protein n=1 Tax=Mytilus coruscus TaxID=42192 RepID=A0A6J8DVK8_MYTCO|nr:unnamed protein product [Mytilus coruscus]